MSTPASRPTLRLDERDGAVFLHVHAVPGSRREGVLGIRMFPEGGALRVAVRARAERGKANAALVKVMAKAAGVAPSSVEIVSGGTSRRKRVKIEGVTAADLRARIGLP